MIILVSTNIQLDHHFSGEFPWSVRGSLEQTEDWRAKFRWPKRSLAMLLFGNGIWGKHRKTKSGGGTRCFMTLQKSKDATFSSSLIVKRSGQAMKISSQVKQMFWRLPRKREFHQLWDFVNHIFKSDDFHSCSLERRLDHHFSRTNQQFFRVDYTYTVIQHLTLLNPKCLLITSRFHLLTSYPGLYENMAQIHKKWWLKGLVYTLPA